MFSADCYQYEILLYWPTAFLPKYTQKPNIFLIISTLSIEIKQLLFYAITVIVW